MSAVQYGPSIRALEGLGWLKTESSGALVPFEDVMLAVHAFDRKVAGRLPRMLTDAKGGSLSSAEAARLYAVWSTAKPTGDEKKTFRQTFYERGKDASSSSREGRRHNTLKLILTVIGSSKSPMNVEAIRRAMCSGVGPNGKSIKIANHPRPLDRQDPVHRRRIRMAHATG
jgi:hypothetical protein